MKSFWLAWQFLTRLPAPVYASVSDKEVGHSQRFYPLIGGVIGAILVSTLWMTTELPESVRAIMLLIIWVAVTGALHIDGLADVADGWIGGQGDRERALEIMKDATSGPMGVSAIVLLLLAKFAMLGQLAWSAWPSLLLAPVMARAVVPFYFLFLPYLRRQGLGRALADHNPWLVTTWSLLLIVMAVIFGLGQAGLYLVLIFMIFNGLQMALWRIKFGGISGDMVGASIEINELLILTLSVILISYPL